MLLDTSEAELVQGGVRLREALHRLNRTEVALQESESRRAFHLRLGDALRVLIDPMTIQAEASRLLGERLLTDRAYYAETDEAQGYIRIRTAAATIGGLSAAVSNSRLCISFVPATAPVAPIAAPTPASRNP